MVSGDCGCDVFEGTHAVIGAVGKVITVDLYIRGCPPAPSTCLRSLIALIEQATVIPHPSPASEGVRWLPQLRLLRCRLRHVLGIDLSGRSVRLRFRPVVGHGLGLGDLARILMAWSH